MKKSVPQSLCLASIAAPLIGQEVIAQTKFQRLCNRVAKDYKLTKLSSIASIISSNAKELAKFARIYEMELSVKPGHNEVVLVGIFDLDAAWLTAGQAIKCVVKNKSYPYVAMKNFTCWKVKGFSEVFAIDTKDDYQVWLGLADDSIDLSEVGWQSPSKVDKDYTQLQFPMVDYREQFNLPLQGMVINGRPVTDAEQLNLIKLNEERIRVKSETVLRTKSMQRKPVIFTIDRPFYLWITHKKTGQLPLITAYITTGYWKRPTE